MTVTFFSNFLVPHQLQFCEEMVNLVGDGFTFVATMPFYSENVTQGFSDLNSNYSFCLKSYEDTESYKKAKDLAKNSDMVILGAAPEKFARMRVLTGKNLYKYSEREFKPINKIKQSPVKFLQVLINNSIYAKSRVYMLCASAYAAGDYESIGAYKGKTYKWGYFPKGSDKSIEELMSYKNDTPVILWAARMIEWKHGEIAVEIAKYLKDKGLNFKLKMIGSGEKKDRWEQLSESFDLQDRVEFVGSLSNKKTIEYMEKADIFLATSDSNEGWGAVVNEAMSAACAVVGCEGMGSVPYLIENDKSGKIYKENDIETAKKSVEELVTNRQKREAIAKNAKARIDGVWCAKVAAENIFKLDKALQKHDENPIEFGPCSRATGGV